MSFRSVILGAAAAALLSTMAQAKVCDYRPSHLLGVDKGRPAAASAGGAGASGFYTLVNTTNGLTMLGNTLAGASGTAGVVAGTSGALGSAAAILMNPSVWIPALVAAAVGTGYEATCAYFVDERITDYDEVLDIMRSFQDHADPEYFRLVENTLNPFIEVRDENGGRAAYLVERLYIVEGLLMHRDRGRNTRIGRVMFVNVEETPAEDN
ncbi:hypothetical protein FGK63_01365 [Ruegeria sediminis]|uniref:Uncharacterized protein n=1 Tax=Ruegeria sediminis TaxID=2583820 RepID=A0ABY2X302_9RHOB|nr:hypothetical protein [Ruegeria sediminis]TMV09746.1 hypothetical protein FGK63_01365 [Ruegeria sediminis]